MENTKHENNDVIQQMFAAGAHYGYSKARRHPSTREYIFGTKNNVEIIDLEKTASLLDAAKEFMAELSREKKKVLFVGTKNEVRGIVEAAAKSCDMPYVTERWIGGTLTNFSEIQKRIKHYKDLTEQKEKGELSKKYTKKEQLLIDRELEKLRRNFGGIVTLDRIPDAIFVVDPRAEHIAVSEARDKGLPIIALMNSDCDASKIDRPIIANDTILPSVTFFVGEVTAAYRDAK